jgi:hypothetical protein
VGVGGDPVSGGVLGGLVGDVGYGSMMVAVDPDGGSRRVGHGGWWCPVVYVPRMVPPESWVVVLNVFAPVFARWATFRIFTLLANGMVAATGRRTVVGMPTGVGRPGRSRSRPRAGSSRRRCGTSTGWAWPRPG